MPLDSQLALLIPLIILAIISPGPDFAITLQNTLRHQRRGGLITALGIACGVSVHVSYSIVGLGYLIHQATWILEGIRYLGAAYLIWLGVSALLPSRAPQKHDSKNGNNNRPPLFALFRQGFLCNAINPKTSLFFIALFTQLLSPETTIPAQVALGLSIALGHLLWFGLLALLLTIPGCQRLLDQTKLWLTRLTGVCMVGLGARLITTN